MSKLKVLFAGESWTIQTRHIKGVDHFTQWGYGEGVKWVKEALEAGEIEVVHLPNHLAIEQFPNSLEKLQEYDCLILSDIGSNTLLLHPQTTNDCMATPNRLEVIQQYVKQGGGLVMIGGYMSYQGIEAKANYAGSPVEEALPVKMLKVDDRAEIPQGFHPTCQLNDHPIMQGLPDQWPMMLFYNRVQLKDEADLLLDYKGEPILAAWDYGQGRSVAFMPDAAPHGAPPEFLDWEYFPRYWQQLVKWVVK